MIGAPAEFVYSLACSFPNSRFDRGRPADVAANDLLDGLLVSAISRMLKPPI